MVVKMMRWPWPPLISKKYEVILVVRRLEGWDPLPESSDKLTVEIRWKGPKASLGSLRRTVKRNYTEEAGSRVSDLDGVVSWDEEFQSICPLSAQKENVFHPWEIAFTVFNGLNHAAKNKVSVVGTTSLNLADYASASEQKDFDINLPLTQSVGSAEPGLQLCIRLSLVELRAAQETLEPVHRESVPVTSPPQSVENVSAEKDELSAIKAGLRKVNVFAGYVSARRAKKACQEDEGSEGGRYCKSDEGEYPFDTDSLDESEEGESDEAKRDCNARKSFSYGSLTHANYAEGSFFSSTMINAEDESWVYYSHRKSDVGSSQIEDTTMSVSEPSLTQVSKRKILPWGKRKLNFRSPKTKGEPLLKKANGEEGGDDIDFDRRQLSSDESFPTGCQKSDFSSSANQTSVSEFGDDNFAVGSWEHKEIVSRDGQMKLHSQVFFASIDQRSERAGGESACTALVAVIADWFQKNTGLMPVKSQFDSLIREGSSEWRNLCENETYRERFPDKHFDLETILQAKMRPLSVVPSKSFIGFFQPEGMDEERFDFLHGAMSFDNIWDEISHSSVECASDGGTLVYVVSWNDHFFILKVEPEAYYIIDTLGERLYEGCNQAYILKFGSDSVIYRRVTSSGQSSDEKSMNDQQNEQEMVSGAAEQNDPVIQQGSVKTEPPTRAEDSVKMADAEEVVFRGKESCKEYMKSFLAAIPVRELQADMKKGLMVASRPLHHRLQIDFHYTKVSELEAEAIGPVELLMAEPALTGAVTELLMAEPASTGAVTEAEGGPVEMC